MQLQAIPGPETYKLSPSHPPTPNYHLSQREPVFTYEYLSIWNYFRLSPKCSVHFFPTSDCGRGLKNLLWKLMKEVSNIPAKLEAVAHKDGCRGTLPLVSQAEQTCTNLLGGLSWEPVCPVSEEQRSDPREVGSAILLGRRGGMAREAEELLSEKHPTRAQDSFNIHWL